jgi:hypothetical protein
LCLLAIILLDVVPHAAEPERVFSLAKWYQSGGRNGLSVGTMNMMMTTKIHYQRQRPAARQAKAQEIREAKRAKRAADEASAAVPDPPLQQEEVEVVSSEEGGVADVEDDEVGGDDDIDNLVSALGRMYEESQDDVIVDSGRTPLSVWTGIDPKLPSLDPFTTVAAAATAASIAPFGSADEHDRVEDVGLFLQELGSLGPT